MAAALGHVGLWVLDCLEWWFTLVSVAHEVFTQARRLHILIMPPSLKSCWRCVCRTRVRPLNHRQDDRTLDVRAPPPAQKKALRRLPALGDVPGDATGLTCIVTGPTRRAATFPRRASVVSCLKLLLVHASLLLKLSPRRMRVSAPSFLLGQAVLLHASYQCLAIDRAATVHQYLLCSGIGRETAAELARRGAHGMHV